MTIIPTIQQRLHQLGVEIPPPHRRVLLVDDEVSNLDVLGALLEDDFEVYLAKSGKEALDVIADNGEMDLVIADQRMPGITGVELLTRLAKEHPETVRIVLTGYTDVAPMLDAINHGAVYRFMLKPFEAEEILAVVSDALAMKDNSVLLETLATSLAQRKGDLNRTLENLQQAQNSLLATERLATVGRATSGLVHDLNNMMTAVVSLPDYIESSIGQGDLVDQVSNVCGLLASEVRVLKRIRHFARAGAPVVEKTSTNISSLIEEVLALYKIEYEENLNPVTVHVDPAAEEIEVDPDRIKHSLLALLSNAAKASPEGAAIRVEVRREASEWTSITVQDEGHGMDNQTLACATEPFFSGFSPPGLGLGLEVVLLCAQVHNGRFELDCPGVGTRARLILPTAEGVT